MRTRHRALAVTALVAVLGVGCAQSAPSRMLSERYTRIEIVDLPVPRTNGAMSLETAIAQRRSVRDFRDEPLPLAVVGQLLWAAQGITGPDGKRAAPSAGALYPLELYVVEQSDIMHYLPVGHRAERRADVDHRAELAHAAFNQAFVATAPTMVVIAARPERTRRKYGAVADDLINREAGHAAQNVLLEATAEGVAAVPVGGFDPRAVQRALALPPDVVVLYLIPVGYPAAT